jgi:acid phosphatase type 7
MASLGRSSSLRHIMDGTERGGGSTWPMWLTAGLCGAILLASCGTTASQGTSADTAVIESAQAEMATGANSPASTETAHPVILAAGDVGRCDSNADEKTSALASQLPHSKVLLLGDIAYDDGTVAEFDACFDTSWGVHRQRIHPVPGNHDYHTAGAAGYFEYFGERAGDPTQGWYSIDLGTWHLVGLNSNCGDVGCGADSAQAEWLRTVLERNAGKCTLVYTHHPRYSSGENGSFDRLAALWEIMDRQGADVLLSAHDHGYERFAPMDAEGEAASEGGIRQFVVGTGGATLRDFAGEEPNSEVRIAGKHGLLELALEPTSYTWRFWSTEDAEPLDTGEAGCTG